MQIGVVSDLGLVFSHGHAPLPVPIPADRRAQPDVVDNQFTGFFGDEIVKSGRVVADVGCKQGVGQLPLRPENRPEDTVHHGVGQKIGFEEIGAFAVVEIAHDDDARIGITGEHLVEKGPQSIRLGADAPSGRQ